MILKKQFLNILKNKIQNLNIKFIFLFFISFVSNILYFSILVLLTLIPLLVTIAFYTLAERKIIAAIQRRKGPNVVGFLGFLQPFSDGLKLLLKEIILPIRINILIFLIAPILTLSLSFLN
jgi:NADH:ubiquinone oxidoreductase subunit H